jgi:uncharacterized protein YbjQ (UPF0145 family)
MLLEIEGVIVVTTDTIPGYRIKEVKGLVVGVAARSSHFGRDLAALLRNIAGGEVREYIELLNKAKDEAIRRMVQEAKAKGANAVIGFRLATTNISAGVAELYAYGTAVLVEKEQK